MLDRALLLLKSTNFDECKGGHVAYPLLLPRNVVQTLFLWTKIGKLACVSQNLYLTTDE